jgi:hypothetical protein
MKTSFKSDLEKFTDFKIPKNALTDIHGGMNISGRRQSCNVQYSVTMANAWNMAFVDAMRCGGSQLDYLVF